MSFWSKLFGGKESPKTNLAKTESDAATAPAAQSPPPRPSPVAVSADEWFAAVLRGDVTAVQTMLSKGADVNAKAASGNTALIMASGKGNRDMTQLLLSKGADVNAKGSNDATALMAAASWGPAALPVAQMLLEAGADIDARNGKGWTASWIAEHTGAKDMANAILRAKGSGKTAGDLHMQCDICGRPGTHPAAPAALIRDSLKEFIRKGYTASFQCRNPFLDSSDAAWHVCGACISYFDLEACFGRRSF
jgi:ankyrin repeat protein